MAQSTRLLLPQVARGPRPVFRELGQLADIDHTYIYRLETGEKQSPSDDLLARLLRVSKPIKEEHAWPTRPTLTGWSTRGHRHDR